MDVMRPAVLFFVTLLFFAPSALFGAEEVKPKPVTGSNDKCLNEKIEIVDGKAVLARGRTDTEQYKGCRDIAGGCNLKKDQNKECTCGRMIYITLEKKTLRLNKCDPDMQKKLAKALAGGAEGMNLFAAQTQIAERIREIDTSTEGGRDQLSQILQSYGVSQTDAKAKVNDETKADAVRSQLLDFVNTSEKSEAKQIANDLGFKLNENLTDAVRLDPKKYAAIFTEEELARSQIGVLDTFPEALRPGIADALAPLCGRLGGCGDNACLSNPNSLTCLGKNPGALTFTPWQTKYGGRPCGLNNNTTCFDTIEGGIAAQANLLATNPRYFGGGNNTILGAFCNGYSTSNCSQYAAFISGQTGIPMNQTVDPNNTQQIAAIMMASSRFENGRGVIYTPEQLQKGLEIAFGNEKLPEGTPGYVARTVFGTNGGTQFGSPFNPNSSASPTNVGYGSAFGNAPPAPIAQAAYTPQPSPVAQATPVSKTVNQNVITSQPQGTSSTSGVAKQLQDALQNPDGTSAAQSPANVIAQPKEVTRGNPITVSWTSIGMSSDTPCVLRAGSVVIAEKNQGASVVPTTQATRLGSLVFTLSCTTSSGVTFQRTAATMVR